ncbi:MAG: ATP-binding protein [Firmicutes bacterium]|nr:ATP-binding protein [Bacillota bacterium]
MRGKEVFKQIIIEFHQSKLPEIIDREITIKTDLDKIISIIGPRRSGKTYLLFQTIKKLQPAIPKETMIYINFEDERLDIKKEDLSFILEAYKELYPQNPLNQLHLFFDEIQNVSGWESFTRRIYDHYTKKIFITGSNSKLLSSEIATSLRGRTIKYEIFPLDFNEFLKFKNQQITSKDIYAIEKKGLIKSLFSEYFKYGGFPEVILHEDKNIKLKILQEYFDVMIYRDIVERYQVKNLPSLKFFIKRIIENVGSPLSVNNIFNELKSQGYKISKDTLYEYLFYLEAVYFLLPVKKYSKSVLKSELSQRKEYGIDNGFISSLTFNDKEMLGAMLENLLAKEFYLVGYEVFYFRGEKECDFVLVKEDNLIPVQVSYEITNKKTFERELAGLLEACEYLGVKQGIIMTYDEKDTIKKNDVEIKILPAYQFRLTKEG